MESVDQLAKKASVLTPVERIQLVEAILNSLDKPDEEIEKCWVIEADSRYEGYKRGEISTIDWADIKKRYTR